MRRSRLISAVAAMLLLATSAAAQSNAALGRLQFIEGNYRVSSAVPGDTASAIWRFRPVLGGKYVELEEFLKVAFRVTIGFDSTSRRYRMSLLDAGTGAFDVYDGDFDTDGALVLQNPHFWRVTFAPTAAGLLWRFEHSTDKGATWKGRPPSELIRIVEP